MSDIFDFSRLEAVLRDWPDVPVPTQRMDEESLPERDSLQERMRQILLASQQAGHLLYKADFMALAMHLMLRQSARSHGNRSLTVPRLPDWPDKQEWNAYHIDALSTGGRWLLTARSWRPDWLADTRAGVYDAAFREVKRSHEMACRADSCIQARTRHQDYRSPGQRDAIRAVFLAAAGTALAVNLPTGTGKSLVGQIGALMEMKAGHLTVVIVPTIALAIDQERQMQKRMQALGHEVYRLAWHSGVSADDKKLMKERIRNGQQLVVFTSPEAACGSLAYALYDAAQAGFLRYFVIDEAHLAVQWGDEFRPYFQMLAGLRAGLLRARPKNHEPFKTLLLSATLTQETLETLRSLFGPPDNFSLVSAVHLRPEPSYWFYKAANAWDKDAKVLEAVRQAPRPFILYVTKREDADSWLWRLRNDLGLERVRRFHGSTPDAERQAIIDQWGNNQLDGIVATSAFGVGIDKEDVRTVIHACVPETLDRFYQEVGRGGRDGLACTSILIYTDGDVEVAQGIGKPTVISTVKGHPRWKVMLDNAVHLENDLLLLDLNLVPPHSERESEMNIAWNLRTLHLLARAGVIDLEALPPVPPTQEQGESDDAFAKRQEAAAQDYFTHAVVQLRNPNHMRLDTWDHGAIADARQHSYAAIDRNFHLLTEILQGNREVSSALCELYQVELDDWAVPVAANCAGCPVCRTTGEAIPPGRALPIPLRQTATAAASQLHRYIPWLSAQEACYIVLPDLPQKQLRPMIVAALAASVQLLEVRDIMLSDPAFWQGDNGFNRLWHKARHTFLMERDLMEDGRLAADIYTQVAAATVLYPCVSTDILPELSCARTALHLIFLPANTPDPLHPHRTFLETKGNKVDLETFIDRTRA